MPTSTVDLTSKYSFASFASHLSAGMPTSTVDLTSRLRLATDNKCFRALLAGRVVAGLYIYSRMTDSAVVTVVCSIHAPVTALASYVFPCATDNNGPEARSEALRMTRELSALCVWVIWGELSPPGVYADACPTTEEISAAVDMATAELEAH